MSKTQKPQSPHTTPCPQCRTEMTSKRENFRYTASGLDYVTLKSVLVYRCPKCGEYEVVIPAIAELHRSLAHLLAKMKRRASPPEVRFMRKWLGWDQKTFAEFLGVEPATVSRWETGAKPISATAERLLRMYVLSRDPVDDYTEETMKEAATVAKARPSPLFFATKGSGWRAAAA